MKRRHFLASLPFIPAALPVAAQAALPATGKGLGYWISHGNRSGMSAAFTDEELVRLLNDIYKNTPPKNTAALWSLDKAAISGFSTRPKP